MNADLSTVLDASDQQLAELGALPVGPLGGADRSADRGGPWDNRPAWDNWHNRR